MNCDCPLSLRSLVLVPLGPPWGTLGSIILFIMAAVLQYFAILDFFPVFWKCHSRPAWGSKSCVFLHVTKMLILYASSEPPLPLERCCKILQAASCTAPLRSAPDVFLQHLSSDIASPPCAATVVLFNAFPRKRDFAPHAGASYTLLASGTVPVHYGNVVLAAAWGLPFFALSFKHKRQACFHCCIFCFLRLHFLLLSLSS